MAFNFSKFLSLIINHLRKNRPPTFIIHPVGPALRRRPDFSASARAAWRAECFRSSTQPEGLRERSRGSSHATPPDQRPPNTPHPGLSRNSHGGGGRVCQEPALNSFGCETPRTREEKKATGAFLPQPVRRISTRAFSALPNLPGNL